MYQTSQEIGPARFFQCRRRLSCVILVHRLGSLDHILIPFAKVPTLAREALRAFREARHEARFTNTRRHD